MQAAQICGATVAVVGLLRICLPGPTVAETANLAPSIERGAYHFAAAGCAGCHTDVKNDGPLLAGGRAIETPFGTFYGPNITPDPEHGIGGWSDADFIRALRHGVAPDGPEGEPAPNITPHPETGIGSWSRTELMRLLKTGMLPDFDVVGSFMGEVVEQSTGRLSEDDLRAIAVYLESLPPIDTPEAKATQAGFDF